MTPTVAPIPDTESLEQLAADIQQRWAGGEPPDAVAALAAHPALWAHKPLVLELAFEEFCLRAERGAAPEPKAFAARFPYPESVARLLAVQSAIDRHPSFEIPGRHPPSTVGERPAVKMRTGEMVEELRVMRPLGRGGFSDVYLMTDTATGNRPMVLKVSTRGDHEAAILGPLNHKHVMPVCSALQVGGLRGILMPYLGLATVETLLAQVAFGDIPSAGWLLRVVATRRLEDPPVTNPPTFPITLSMNYTQVVLHIVAALADALEYLHARGVAHRDLKPSNVLIGPTGHPYLLDFNLADDRWGGRVGGTIAYAAPEVLTALRSGEPNPSIDWFAADVFSFGVLACELLLTRHPYLTPTALMHGDVDIVTRVAVDAELSVPPAVHRLLGRCLSAIASDRPTADQLAHALKTAVASGPHQWKKRVAVVALATAGITATLALAAGYPKWSGQSPPDGSPAIAPTPSELPPVPVPPPDNPPVGPDGQGVVGLVPSGTAGGFNLHTGVVTGVALVPLTLFVIGRVVAWLRRSGSGLARPPADVVAHTVRRLRAEAVVPLAVVGAGVCGLASSALGLLPVVAGMVGGFFVTAVLADRVFAGGRK